MRDSKQQTTPQKWCVGVNYLKWMFNQHKLGFNQQELGTNIGVDQPWFASKGECPPIEPTPKQKGNFEVDIYYKPIFYFVEFGGSKFWAPKKNVAGRQALPEVATSMPCILNCPKHQYCVKLPISEHVTCMECRKLRASGNVELLVGSQLKIIWRSK